MRILIAVQRYGDDVPGGAEHLARWVAEGMARRGHDVEVVTSCALSYQTWENSTAAGTTVERQVVVHRLEVDQPRDVERFNRLSARLDFATRGTSPVLEASWLTEQGPSMPTLAPWLDANAGRFDIAILYTYLYETTFRGIERLTGRLPVVMHATAHEEPPIHLRRLQAGIRQATELWCSTPEEAALLDDITHDRVPTRLMGIGVSPGAVTSVGRLRAELGFAHREYVTVVGRVDPSKGVDELMRYFAAFKERHPSNLALVVIGDRVHDLAADGDVIFTGFLPEAEMNGLVRDGLLLIQPSYFESFSLALCEAWLAERPALVNGNCSVLAGQARRSGAAIPYGSYAEFEAGLSLLLDSPDLRAQLGGAGASYVVENYGPDVVLDRIESSARRLAGEHPERHT